MLKRDIRNILLVHILCMKLNVKNLNNVSLSVINMIYLRVDAFAYK